MGHVVAFRPTDDKIEFRVIQDAAWGEGRVSSLATLTHAEVRKLGGENHVVRAFASAVKHEETGRFLDARNPAYVFAQNIVVFGSDQKIELNHP